MIAITIHCDVWCQADEDGKCVLCGEFGYLLETCSKCGATKFHEHCLDGYVEEIPNPLVCLDCLLIEAPQM